MQEVFEKIKERLEKERKEITKWDSDKHYIYIEGADWMGAKSIEIVDQVAEEYDNDFCEWESDFNRFSGNCKRETSCGYTFYDLKHAEHFKVCPYCGKKIKGGGAMSMISELVRKIRIYEKEYRSGATLGRAIEATEDILKQAAETIEELSAKLANANMERSTAYYNNGWIPCSERLPKGRETYKVLVTDKDGIMAVCYFLEVTEAFKVCWDGEEFCGGIAWQPLPEPYKEKK